MLVIVNAILAHAISVAVGALAAMLLPIRRPGLYWLVVLSQIPVALVKWAFSMDISYINVACFVFYYAVVPLLFWDAALPARIACAGAILTLVALLECVSAASYYYLGYPVGYPAARLVLSDDALLILIRAASIAVLLAAGTAIAPWTRRLAGSEPASRRVGAAYTAIVLLQVALMLIVFFSPVIGGLQDLRLLAYAAPAMAASMAAMLAGLRSIRRSATALVERSAAREQEERLDSYLSAMREQIDEAATAARFRHDHRNHLTVIRRLVDEGDVVAARAYAAGCRRAIEGGDAP